MYRTLIFINTKLADAHSRRTSYPTRGESIIGARQQVSVVKHDRLPRRIAAVFTRHRPPADTE